MNYLIRIAHIDSTNILKESEEIILNQGILQGNRAGPIVWVIMSTLIIVLIKKIK